MLDPVKIETTPSQDPPLVSFILFAYRQEEFVREAIEGAFAQTYRPLEILLSDDHSPDATYAIMEEMARKYSGPHRVLLNRNEANLGIGGHVNRAVELTSGELIVASAGDDVSLPERAAKLAAAWLSSGRTAHALHSAERRITADGRDLGEQSPSVAMIENPSTYNLIVNTLHPKGATVAWSRTVFENFGPMNDNIVSEDMVIPFRASLIGDIQYVPEALIFRRIGGISDLSNTNVIDELFGSGVVWMKRWIDCYRQYVIDLGIQDTDQTSLLICLCRERIRQLELTISIAEANHFDRVRLARLILTSPSTNHRWKLVTVLKYLLPGLYRVIYDVRKNLGYSNE